MVTNIVNLIVECMKLLLVMCGILNYKFRKSAAAIILLILSIIALIILGIINNDYQVSLFIIVTVFICFLAVEGRRKVISAFLSFFTICCIDDFLILILRIVFSISDEKLNNDNVVGILLNSASLFVLVTVAVGMQYFYYRKRNILKQYASNSSLLYLGMVLCGGMALSIYMSPFVLPSYKNTVRNNSIVAVCACALGMLFLALGVLLIYNNNSKRHYKQVAEINKKLLELQQNYYQMLLDKETETRKFRHDISNHILCVDTLLKEKEYDEAEDYLASLRTSLSDLKPKYQTGNVLVNAIVNDISGKYKNVNFSWQGMFPQNLWISNMDLCVIFSNVLENAFYAASVCSEQRNVRVDIKSVSNSIMIWVENDISAPVDESKGKLLTQKADKKNHGFGTMNVRACVNTNGGSVEYKYTDKVFTVEIVLPNVIQ